MRLYFSNQTSYMHVAYLKTQSKRNQQTGLYLNQTFMKSTCTSARLLTWMQLFRLYVNVWTLLKTNNEIKLEYHLIYLEARGRDRKRISHINDIVPLQAQSDHMLCSHNHPKLIIFQTNLPIESVRGSGNVVMNQWSNGRINLNVLVHWLLIRISGEIVREMMRMNVEDRWRRNFGDERPEWRIWCFIFFKQIHQLLH